MAPRYEKPRYERPRRDPGLNVLVGALLTMAVALVLVSMSGGFGHTRLINQEDEPVWPSSSFK